MKNDIEIEYNTWNLQGEFLSKLVAFFFFFFLCLSTILLNGCPYAAVP